jgi:DNA-directed RNA polymerase subunit alpha
VRRVAYSVEQARVGQRTDFDKLTLDIETDGSIDPQAALREAAEILISSLSIFTDEDRIEELRAGIQTVGDLVSKSEGELNAIPNFGKKSIDEVVETLSQRGLNLRND